jgi:uncharacterized protein YciI
MTEAGQYLYRIQPARESMLRDGPTAEEAEVVGHHFEYLQRLAARGVVLLAGRTLTEDADSFGIVILAAASEAEARDIMDGDPAVVRGVMQARLFPFRIALSSLSG